MDQSETLGVRDSELVEPCCEQIGQFSTAWKLENLRVARSHSKFNLSSRVWFYNLKEKSTDSFSKPIEMKK